VLIELHIRVQEYLNLGFYVIRDLRRIYVAKYLVLELPHLRILKHNQAPLLLEHEGQDLDGQDEGSTTFETDAVLAAEEGGEGFFTF
jgi:hypothetical protein